MRRVVAMATFVILWSLIPAFAQRGGGGHAGGFGGGHGGFGGSHFYGGHAGGFSGHSFGGHAYGGMRASPGLGARGFRGSSLYARGFRNPGFRRSATSRSFNRRSSGYRDRDRDSDRDRFRRGRGRNRWGWGYPLWGWNYPWWGFDYYPWWWDQDDYEFDQQQADEFAQAREMNQESLAEQRIRHEEDQDLYAPQDGRPQNRPQSQSQGADPDPAPIAQTVLIFHDQHQQEVQNYAIVGQMLWAFGPHRTQKIPLSELDLAATTQANDDRGVEFRVPSANAGQ